MKKIHLVAIIALTIGICSCKKDRVCECTSTYTAANGDMTTNPQAGTTYRNIRKKEAKDLCQKSTYVSVSPSGGTSTTVYDCKLK